MPHWLSRTLKRRRMSAPAGPSVVSGRRRRGFSLVELTVVLIVAGVALTGLSLRMGGLLPEMAAHSAAQLFARDLSVARSSAVRTGESVVIRFYEPNCCYSISVVPTGTQLIRRRFSVDADIDLAAIDLEMLGDSLVFTSRGFADLSAIVGPLGTATFSAGVTTYTVSFNTVGASRVEKS